MELILRFIRRLFINFILEFSLAHLILNYRIMTTLIILIIIITYILLKYIKIIENADLLIYLIILSIIVNLVCLLFQIIIVKNYLN